MKQARWSKAYTACCRDPKLSPGAKAALQVLRSYCKFNQDTCWPSTRLLVEALGCDRKAIFRYLNELEAQHWIRRKHRRRPNQAFTSTKYELLDERKSLQKEAFPCPQNGHSARLRELPDVKYALAKQLKRKIIPMPCSQNGDAIKKDQDTGS